MFSVIGAGLFSIIAIMSVLAVCGLPVGEFTMGGRHRVLPMRFRFMAAISLLIQLFAIVVILQAGGYMRMWFSLGATKMVCIVFAVYLSLNTVLNAISSSAKERYVMTPISLAAAICFWVTALSMQ